MWGKPFAHTEWHYYRLVDGKLFTLCGLRTGRPYYERQKKTNPPHRDCCKNCLGEKKATTERPTPKMTEGNPGVNNV